MRRLLIKIQQTVVTLSSLYKSDKPPVPPIKKFWLDSQSLKNKMIDGGGHYLVFRTGED